MNLNQQGDLFFNTLTVTQHLLFINFAARISTYLTFAYFILYGIRAWMVNKRDISIAAGMEFFVETLALIVVCYLLKLWLSGYYENRLVFDELTAFFIGNLAFIWIITPRWTNLVKEALNPQTYCHTRK